MKKFLWLIVCLMTMVSVKAQKLNSIETQSIKKDSIAASLTLSGKYLKESATWDYVFVGCAIGASGTILATQIIANNNKNEEVRNLGYLCGGMLAAWATFGYIMKVQYKWKSGKCLELYGNGVRVTF